MKLTFVGCTSAFSVGEDAYHSNMLIENCNEHFLIDCGSDIRRSLYRLGVSYVDIPNVYISHLHGDHTYGLEWLGMSRYFDKNTSLPKLYIRDTLADIVWENILKGSMSTLDHEKAELSTFFDIHLLKENEDFVWNEISFKLITVIHYYNNGHLAPSYGLMITINDKKILLTTDTQFTPDLLEPYYKEADIIFHDCETSKFPSTVHAHYDDMKTLNDDYKSKMWLYHYNSGALPDAEKDGFKGFVSRGQSFDF
jgi:ribonuclease BN (tRNA processing enzyme)